MDIVDAERFITLLQREKFDYTRWREALFEDLTIEELSARAMAYVTSQEKRENLLVQESIYETSKKS